MELPIQVAVRVGPNYTDEIGCVRTVQTTPRDEFLPPLSAGIVQLGAHSFPVSHALPINCTQGHVFAQVVYPLTGLLLEGFDASIVTYGQTRTGKSYTLYGPGFNCVYGEAEQGAIQRCVREIFAQLNQRRERTFMVNIAWIEICDDEIVDLLGDSGNVQCTTIGEVFQWMTIGMASQQQHQKCHNVFTLTLEQQWVTPDGLLQHRLSTASFCDLVGTERMYVSNSVDQHLSIPKELDLQSLERLISSLCDPTAPNNQPQYNDSTLTTMLKDSFGGRAQTLLILCVSPLEQDVNETLANLQFACKAQFVRNFVTLNTFSDNNTPVHVEESPPSIGQPTNPSTDNFNIQFAASQWLKLVSNAEGLFSKLITTKAVADEDREQIEEWLFLKQECEECLSSGEMNIGSTRHLGPIEEADEPDETTSDPETSCQQNSDNDSDDCESQRLELEDKIENLMEELRIKTDNLVQDQYSEFIKTHPIPVMNSNDSFRPGKTAIPGNSEAPDDEDRHDEKQDHEDERRNSTLSRGRRRSIHPESLSTADIERLKRVASREQMTPKTEDDFLDGSKELHKMQANKGSEQIQRKLRKVVADLEETQHQIKKLDDTIALKQQLISDLIKNSDTRTSAKNKFNKKKNKLENDYEKTKKQLAKAVVSGKDKIEIERLKVLTSQMEGRLQDLTSIKNIAGESGQKIKKLQQSLQESKKQVESLQKAAKRNRKLKQSLDEDLKIEEAKEKKEKSEMEDSPSKGKTNIKDVSARISHLDQVLKEKSHNLEQVADGGEKESLRHEIRNLRRTRDHLLDLKCSLDQLKRGKILSHKEERKLLECDEAIEAIDAAIEFKNEMICGSRRSVDTSERLQREKGEQMLMARLNKLSPEEMRILLYKYFQKVIDLRESSRKLEVQLTAIEKERDAWEWRERELRNRRQKALLEAEHRALLLQKEHDNKEMIMLRQMAEETSANSSLADTRIVPAHNHHHVTHYNDTDMEIDLYKPGPSKLMLKSKHHPGDFDLCPIPSPLDAHYSRRPLDKIKEKEREGKNKLLAKFQMFTRYNSSSSDRRKVQDSSASNILLQNYNILQPAALPVTKVTRKNNRLIIEQGESKRQ